MAIIPPHIVDDIMQISRIEEVIGEFVQLKKSGANLKGLSPFTDEKTPSFVVSPAKQIFKCFSSGKGGTVVSFLMEKEHYSYPEGQSDHYNDDVINILRDNGVKCCPSAVHGINSEEDDLFHLKRIMVGFGEIEFPKNLISSSI